MKPLRLTLPLLALIFIGWNSFAVGGDEKPTPPSTEEACNADYLGASPTPEKAYQGVLYRGHAYSTEIFDRLPKTNAFYIRKSGPREINLANAKYYILLMHGLGASYSNPTAMFQSMQIYNGTLFDSKGKPGKVMRNMNSVIPDYPRGLRVAESLPVPGAQHYGLEYQNFPDNETLIELYKNHIEDVRKQLPEDAQIIIHGRSFSGSLALEMNYKFPGLIDKLILVSPTYPDSDSMTHAIQNLIADSKKNGYYIYEDWVQWGFDLMLEMNWPKDQNDPFKGTPTLILQGGLDVERTELETKIYEAMAEKHDHVRYYRNPEAYHDVTKIAGNTFKQKRVGIETFKEIFPFIYGK